MVEISEIFSTSSQTSLLQDATVTCVQTCCFFKNLVLVQEMAVLECFWWEHSEGTYGVNFTYCEVKACTIIVNSHFRINDSPTFGWY